VISDGDAASNDADGGLSIQQASEILSVPAPTIRSWERRYGVPVADRSSGGHRRYSRDQLEQLQSMRDLIARGQRPAEAATRLHAEHAASPRKLLAAFLDAARDLEPDRIARTLEVATSTLGLDRTVDDVVIPGMREVGEWWHAGRIDVAHEHLATSSVRAWLAALALVGPLRREPPIILCCGPRDHHTLGLEAIGALLRQRRWDCRLLGARTPVESLRHAVRETHAAAVVLACHVTAGRPAAVEALRFADRQGAFLFYGGGAFTSRRSRQGVPGRYLGTNLAQAADLVTDTITAARTDSAPEISTEAGSGP
jgi:MerR family transcriptional regulator, light-induced transcriptional regulator